MSKPPKPRTAAPSAPTARRSAAPLLLACACVAAAGCRGPRVLPGEAIAPRAQTPDAASPAERIRAANATPAQVSSFSAACRLSLVTPEGKAVNLDGAIAAAETPAGNSLRLQAWKFDRPALDLTVTPAGRFLFIRGQNGEEDTPEGFAALPAGGLPTLAPLLTELPGGAKPAGPGRFAWPAAAFGIRGAGSVRVTVAGGLVSGMEILDAAGVVRQAFGFANFRSVDGVAWPMDWTLSGAIEGTVLLEDVELDPELPAGAFVAPEGARRF